MALALLAANLPLVAPAAALADGASSFTAKLTGSHEIPIVSTPATGLVSLSISGSSIVYLGLLNGLSGAVTAELDLAPIGRNGPIAFPLQATSDRISGQLTAADLAPSAGVTFDQAVAALLAGGAYINVRTAAHPAGELRGQLQLVTDHPAFTITAGSPPGGTRDYDDFFPRSLTVPTGSIVTLVVTGQHTATLLPAGQSPIGDVVPVPAASSPAGCGTQPNPCVFDGTSPVSEGPGALGRPSTMVIQITAPAGTYALHSRLQAAMIGSLQVVAPGSPDVSSLDDIAVAIAAQVAAEQPSGTPTSAYSGLAGLDILYPDCKHGTPTSSPGELAVIGVNGGKMFRYNPCLAEQYDWAKAMGTPSLYINTNAAYGPTAGQGATGPAGTCSTSATACRAYNYGYNGARAAWRYAYHQLGAANLPDTWWLDVETSNTWFIPAGTANRMVIQGALDFLGRTGRYGAPSMGYTVGIYSTTLQWTKIVGTSFKPGLPVWYATVVRTPAKALQHCTTPFNNDSGFTGGPVWLVQYQPGGHDTNVGCP